MTLRFLDRASLAVAAVLLAGCSGAENFNSVENIRALRSVSPPSLGVTVLVRNHSASGDHGGGLFWYDSKFKCEDDSGCDNNGTLIRPNVKGSKQKGRWIRMVDNPGVVSVQWFGAQGNGSNNDLCAIKGALATTPVGGTVIFPRPERGYRVAPVDDCPIANSDAVAGALIQVTRSVNLRGEGGVVKQTDLEAGAGNSEIRIVSGDWNVEALEGQGDFVPRHEYPVIAVLNPADAAAKAFLHEPYCEVSQAEIFGYPMSAPAGASHLRPAPVPIEEQLPGDSVLEGHSFSLNNLKLEHGSHGIWSRATIAGDQSNWQDLRISNPRCAGIRLSDGADFSGLTVRRLSIESPGDAPSKDMTCSVHGDVSVEENSVSNPVVQYGISVHGAALKDASLNRLRIRNTRLAGIHIQNPTDSGHRLAIEHLVLGDNHGAGLLAEGQVDLFIQGARFANNGRELGHPDLILSNGSGAVAVGSVSESGGEVGPGGSESRFPPLVLKHLNQELTGLALENSEFGAPSACQGSSGNAVDHVEDKRVRLLSTHNSARVRFDGVAFRGASDVIDVAHSRDTRIAGSLSQGADRVTVFASSQEQCGEQWRDINEGEADWPQTGAESEEDRSVIHCEVPYQSTGRQDGES